MKEGGEARKGKDERTEINSFIFFFLQGIFTDSKVQENKKNPH